MNIHQLGRMIATMEEQNRRLPIMVLLSSTDYRALTENPLIMRVTGGPRTSLGGVPLSVPAGLEESVYLYADGTTRSIKQEA